MADNSVQAITKQLKTLVWEDLKVIAASFTSDSLHKAASISPDILSRVHKLDLLDPFPVFFTCSVYEAQTKQSVAY